LAEKAIPDNKVGYMYFLSSVVIGNKKTILYKEICFFQPRSPVSPSACLTVCLPGIAPAKAGVTSFRTVDPMDDLGVSSTPGELVLQKKVFVHGELQIAA